MNNAATRENYPKPGDLIDGRYRVVERLGVGGMGAVYKAGAERLGGREVAVKVLRANVGESDEFRARFRREAEIAARLDHPAIIKVTDYGKTEAGLLYMVLEYVNGVELKTLLRQNRKGLPIPRVIAITSQILEALGAAHEAGIVHRDLKPANIMIETAGGRDVVKLLDFGVASMRGAEAITVTGEIMGTAAYMAPEQTLADTTDGRSDIYSMGVILYEMLTGEPPFKGTTVTELIKAHRSKTPPDPIKLRPDLPPALAEVIRVALAKDPEDRHASAADFTKALESSVHAELGNDRTVPAVLGAAGGAEAWSASSTARTVVSGEGVLAPMTGLYSRLLGQTIDGKYEIKQKLGEGGMGAVYKAHNTLLGRDVAFKVMHPSHADDPTFRERFLREVRVMMDFVHPNAITVRDSGLSREGLLYMTLDYSEGRPLSAIIAQGRLPADRALNITRQILSALAEGHRKGIVHRDIKPDNVLVERTREGADHVRVLDFGIAKIMENDETADNPGLTGQRVIGTPHYMSPEQASGERVDTRSDLYAVGCVLYEMMTGSRVFEGTTVMQMLMAHVSKDPISPRERAPDADIPVEVDRLIVAALAKEPEDRIDSAKTFIAKIDELRRDLGASPPPPSTTASEAPTAPGVTAVASAGSGSGGGWGLPLTFAAIALVAGGIAAGLALNVDKVKPDKTPRSASSVDSATRQGDDDKTPKTGPESGDPEPGDARPEVPPAEVKPTATDGPETPPETTPESTPEATPKSEPETTPDSTPKATPEPEPETTPDSTPEATPKSEPETTPESAPKATPKSEPETTPESAPEATPKSEPETTPKATPKSEPETAPQPQVAQGPATEPGTPEPEPEQPPMAGPGPEARPVDSPDEGSPESLPDAPPPAEQPGAPADPQPGQTQPAEVKPVSPPRGRKERPTIAVLPFDIRRDAVIPSSRGVRWVMDWQRQTRVLIDTLNRTLVNMNRFDVLERDRLQAVLTEQNLELEGRLSKDQAKLMGEALGADVFVTGVFEGGSYSRTWQGENQFTANRKEITTVELVADIKVIEVRTTRIVLAKKIRATDRRERMVTSRQPFRPGKGTLEALRDKLCRAIAVEIMDQAYPLRAIKVAGATVILNRGKGAGMQTGQRYALKVAGEPIVDPDSGMELGTSEKSVAIVEVTEVLEKFSKAKVVSGAPVEGARATKAAPPPAPERKPRKKPPGW